MRSKPPKFALAATVPKPSPSIKSIVPYGLVIASLAYPETARGIPKRHAKTHRPRMWSLMSRGDMLHRRSKPDFIAQFFQGLFGGPQAATKGSRGSRSAARSIFGSDDCRPRHVDRRRYRRASCGRRRGASHPADGRPERAECIDAGGRTTKRGRQCRGAANRNQCQ